MIRGPLFHHWSCCCGGCGCSPTRPCVVPDPPSSVGAAWDVSVTGGGYTAEDSGAIPLTVARVVTDCRLTAGGWQDGVIDWDPTRKVSTSTDISVLVNAIPSSLDPSTHPWYQDWSSNWYDDLGTFCLGLTYQWAGGWVDSRGPVEDSVFRLLAGYEVWSGGVRWVTGGGDPTLDRGTASYSAAFTGTRCNPVFTASATSKPSQHTGVTISGDVTVSFGGMVDCPEPLMAALRAQDPEVAAAIERERAALERGCCG